MKKIILYCLFVSLINFILILMVAFTVEENRETIDRVAPSSEALRHKYERLGALRLSPAEVQQISSTHKVQISHLNQMGWVMKFTAIFIALVIVWGIRKMQWRITRFDGLTLLMLTSLLFGLHWLFDWFNSKFEGGHNATMNVRISISTGLFIIQPILYYISYRWNNLELIQNFHRQKWISITAIVLTVLSTAAALIIGFALLVTPDVSGFTS